jgi:hypothetical protein
MSKENPIDLRQDRRQWLKTSATVLGASLLTVPAVSAEMVQAETKASAPAKPAAAKSTRFFNPAHEPISVSTFRSPVALIL